MTIGFVSKSGGLWQRPTTCNMSSAAPWEAAGVEFIDENGGGPGVRLRNRQQKGLAAAPGPRVSKGADRLAAVRSRNEFASVDFTITWRRPPLRKRLPPRAHVKLKPARDRMVGGKRAVP